MHARRSSSNNIFGSYYDNFLDRLRQAPMRSPSVFNFYQPDFSPPGPLQQNGLLAPVSQLFDTESMVAMATTHEEFIQRFHDDANNSFPNNPSSFLLDTSAYQALLSDDLRDLDDLIERLNLVFMAGGMSEDMKQVLRDVHDPAEYLATQKWQVVIDLVNIIALSPQFGFQQ